MTIRIPRPRYPIPAAEVEFVPIRAQGAGGQHVNKVSSAVHLRFDIGASSLPQELRARLLARTDQRISRDGVIVIKAQDYRSAARNREDALRRLQELIADAARTPKQRRPTRPGKAAVERRLDAKARRGRLKSARRSTGDGDCGS
ncbi:MAG: aminoacyl-tRNA hydrolase [Rhodocyclaceae bacterium]|nr:aminoacyl-tRNA hydrolase [Rhodocyclaceae bacterium]